MDPLHARKMTALLQSVEQTQPILLRVDIEAGHGVGKPITKLIAEQADYWTFMSWRLGLPATSNE